MVAPSPTYQKSYCKCLLNGGTNEEIIEYHLKRLYDLSKKRKQPEIEKPTRDQKIWVLNRLKNPSYGG